MKKDPYKHKERYEKWKANLEKPDDMSRENFRLITKYVFDMEKGINISNGSAKGGRSYPRLNALIQRMMFLARKFKEIYDLDSITEITEEKVVTFFNDMKHGNIKTYKGNAYKSTCTYVSVFKAFWHWWMKVNKKEGIIIQDITNDLDKRGEKPSWVYMDEKQIRELAEHAKREYKVLIWFLYDTGIRAPTELINIKVSDLLNNCKELHIREEISKTFGRRINLILCPELLREYIKEKGLTNEDQLFSLSPGPTNQYFKRLGKKVFGDGNSEAGEKYSNLTLYDFRHCSCCYWLPRYKSESALKYRFGWKNSDKIHYYSELFGMKDTISEEDLLVDVTKTEVEKRLNKTEKENQMLKEKIANMESMVRKLLQSSERAVNEKGDVVVSGVG